jgi:hypothetical protein
MRNLTEDIESRAQTSEGELLCRVYRLHQSIDLMKRENLVQKLNASIRQANPLLKIAKNILAINYIKIDEGITTSKTFKQMASPKDPLSPLLFYTATGDVIEALDEQGT